MCMFRCSLRLWYLLLGTTAVKAHISKENKAGSTNSETETLISFFCQDILSYLAFRLQKSFLFRFLMLGALYVWPLAQK
uniref:Secreted protein n=1 Tax=Rhipicephalus microplus TaxID=6941 RepID=A0A6M2DB68_RHIMP